MSLYRLNLRVGDTEPEKVTAALMECGAEDVSLEVLNHPGGAPAAHAVIFRAVSPQAAVASAYWSIGGAAAHLFGVSDRGRLEHLHSFDGWVSEDPD